MNRNGDRYASEMNFEPYVTNARMAQPGNVAWSVFDADWEKNMRIQWPTKCDEFIAQVKDGDQINQAIESGYCLTADTLEELAEQMGVPTDRLLATVESYNGMCDAGEDTQFQTPANYLAKVATAPFYAVPVSATLLVLPFGLHVDRNHRHHGVAGYRKSPGRAGSHGGRARPLPRGIKQGRSTRTASRAGRSRQGRPA